MDVLQLAIMASTVVVLGGVAAAFFKSESMWLRLGAIGAFGVFYIAMVLWAPTDANWANISLMVVIVIALGSRMYKPPEKRDDEGGPTHG